MRTKLLKIICAGLLALIVLPLLPANAKERRGGCSISPALTSPRINQRCNTSGRSRHSRSGSAGRSSGSSGFSRSSGPQGGQLSEPWLEIPSLYIFSLGVGPIFQLSPADSNIYGLRVNVGYGTNEEVWGLDLGTINSAARFSGIQLGGWNKIVKIIGLQAGLVNSTTSTYGSQLGGWNYTERIPGLQVGLFNSAASAMGLQLSGWNDAGEVLGLQLGGMNTAGDVSGFQLSLWNAAEKVSGLQLGLVIPGWGLDCSPASGMKQGKLLDRFGVRNVAGYV